MSAEMNIGEIKNVSLFLDRAQNLVSEIKYKDWTFYLGLYDTRPYLQVKWWGPCSDTKMDVRQSSRKYMLSRYMTDSEVVQTALKAVLTAEEHEAREKFTYKGRKIFGPHFDVEALVDLCDKGAISKRDER